MESPYLVWGGFFALVAVMLSLDLGVFHRRSKTVGLREAVVWSVVWIGIGLLFNGFVLYRFGVDKAMEYLTAYLVEKSLSLDNLFVFLALFSYFGVKSEYQHKVLFWGILGAILTRSIFIATGTVLLERLVWLMYLFGAFLIYKGIVLWRSTAGEEKAFGDLKLVRWFRKIFPVSEKDHKDRFFVREKNERTGKLQLVATGLFLVLIAAEVTDLIFAIDSIPAVIGITQDPFILITSNIMAILGMRSLYFVLAAVNFMFRFLQQGMCLVLVFVGAKMLLHDFYHVPTLWSLAVIAALILGSILLSVIFPGQTVKDQENERKSK